LYARVREKLIAHPREEEEGVHQEQKRRGIIETFDVIG
jgi:hypothetical protein